MNFEEIRQILASKDDKALVEWCDEHLVSTLKKSGFKMYQPPYVAEISDKSEQYEYTWESGHTGILTRYFADVFELKNGEKHFIGQYELGDYKGVKIDGTFQPIYRNGKWYALVSPDVGIKVYSLPELKLIAETPQKDKQGVYIDSYRVEDIYCPRFVHHLHTFKSTVNGVEEDDAFYHTYVDDKIEKESESKEWESAPFALIGSYEPLASGTDCIRMVDLRNIESGILEYYPDFDVDWAEWIPLNQIFNFSFFDIERPALYMVTKNRINVITGKPITNDDMKKNDYFTWTGKKLDARTRLGKKLQKVDVK